MINLHNNIVLNNKTNNDFFFFTYYRGNVPVTECSVTEKLNKYIK